MSERSNSKIQELYYSFVNDFIGEVKSNEFYDYFINALESSERNSSMFEKFIERKVDMKWVEAIENTIIPLDEIIRNPLRFIKNDEEIIPIEQARQITTESIRHLAQHTSMIASVNGDEVTPNKILNIIKNESFDVYENRFIYTLLQKLEYFLDKRLELLISDKNVSDKFEIKMSGKASTGHDNLSYNLEMCYETPHVSVAEEVNLVHVDVSNMSSMQRIERIRKILYNFQSSKFAKDLSGCALVRPPLNMTNVLTKNQNFKKAVELWLFIERYEEKGFAINYVERESTPTEQLQKEFFGTIALQYVCLKASRSNVEDLGDYGERKKIIESKVVKTSIDEIMENYDLSVDEVRHIFIDRIERKKKKEQIEFQKVRNAVLRAIKLGKSKIAEENARRRELAEKERKRLKDLRDKERKAQEKLKEKEKLEKQRIKEEQERQRRLEREEKERQIQLAREEKARQLQLEREEKARLRAEELRKLKRKKAAEKRKLDNEKLERRIAEAKLRHQRQEEKQAEKERQMQLAREERERQRLIQKGERERQMQLAREERERQKQLDKEARERQKAAEQKRLEKEKIDNRIKAAKERHQKEEAQRKALEKAKEKQKSQKKSAEQSKQAEKPTESENKDDN